MSGTISRRVAVMLVVCPPLTRIGSMRRGMIVLEGLENSAREAKKGLWAYPHPVPPWENGEKEAGEPPDA